MSNLQYFTDSKAQYDILYTIEEQYNGYASQFTDPAPNCVVYEISQALYLEKRIKANEIPVNILTSLEENIKQTTGYPVYSA
jgi:hypothetical protein